MKQIKNSIVKGLRDYLNCDIVPTDTAAKRPSYPFMSYKIITISTGRGTGSITDAVVTSEGNAFEYDILVTRSTQPELTLSVNTYSEDEDEARELSIKAADWFLFTGYDYLKENGIIAVNVSGVSDRTTLITDEYERRYGFDARLRIARSVSKITETIETHNLNGNIIKSSKANVFLNHDSPSC